MSTTRIIRDLCTDRSHVASTRHRASGAVCFAPASYTCGKATMVADANRTSLCTDLVS